MSQTAWEARGPGRYGPRPANGRWTAGNDETPDAPDEAAVLAEFRAAWTRHAQAVADRCSFLMGGRGADADEAVGRVSLAALSKYRAHRRRIQDVRKWLLGIARNACMNIYRERAREARYCPPRWAEAGEELRLAAADESPEQRLLAQEQVAVLRRAVDALPPRLRVPLRMRLQELPDREIASVLGLRAATVRKRLQEAREALRPAMAAYRDGRTPAGRGPDARRTAHIPAAPNV